jgi:hypothetical protein
MHPTGVRIIGMSDLRAVGGDDAVSRDAFDFWERAAPAP